MAVSAYCANSTDKLRLAVVGAVGAVIVVEHHGRRSVFVPVVRRTRRRKCEKDLVLEQKLPHRMRTRVYGGKSFLLVAVMAL